MATLRRLAGITPLLQWILSAPVLLVIAVLVLAIVWRAALAAFGIPDLFWSEGAFRQALAGIGVGALFGHLGILGFLLDTQRISHLGISGKWSARIELAWVSKVVPPAGEPPALLASYLVRTSLPLVVIAMASALRAPGGVPRFWLPLTTLGAFIVSASLSTWLSRQHVPLLAPSSVRARARTAGLGDLHSLAYAFLIVQVIVYGILWGLYRLGYSVSAALAVCVLLGLLSSFYACLKYFFPLHVSGWLAGGFVAYVALNALGGHQLPDLDYRNKVALDGPRMAPQPEAATTRNLTAWSSARAAAGGGGKPPLIVVAVDGGGIRAAVWTTVVMSQLERDVPNFPYYVRVVTGASGGMVGIASYIGSLQAPAKADRHRDLDDRAVGLDELVDRVATDSLGAVARELVFKDLVLPPFLHPTSDRGLALERAWEKNTRILRQHFSDLAKGEEEGWRPSLIVSPLMVEDGRRLLISNLDVGDLATVPGQSPSLQAIEYFGRIEQRPGKLRLSTAVRLNASFPYVSPPAELPTEPARHTLDAGYYDEHGVDLAGTWIWTHRDWLQANTSGVLLVQVPDTRTRARKQAARIDRRDWWAAGLMGVTGPVEALLTSGGAAADYRNDQLLRILADSFNSVSRPDFFTTVVLEPEGTKATETLPGCGRSRLRAFLGDKDAAFEQIALSWRLTRCEVSRLKESIRGNDQSTICADRRRFQDWWNAHKPDTEPTLAVQCPPAPL